MNDILTARENFPYLNSGKIYFNHASSGPISITVREKLSEVILEKSETDIDEYQKFLQASGDTKNMLSKMINTIPERIAFVDNTTNGINILAQAVKWKRGDRILLNDLEFPANVYPFLNLKNEGVEIDFIKSNNGIVTAEEVIKNIKPKTKLVSISQVQFLTGYRANLEKIGEVCKQNKIIFSIDAIQGLGAVRLDVQKANISFLSSGTQKWLLGLQGLGFIYVSEELQNMMRPKIAGWLSVDDAWNLLNYDFKPKKTAEYFQSGTLNTLGVYALNASLKFFNGYGFDLIEKKVVENSAYLMEQLEKIGIKPILQNCPKENLAGIVTFKHHDSKRIFDALIKNNISCSLREGMIRFSPHFYNINQEADKVADILAGIIK